MVLFFEDRIKQEQGQFARKGVIYARYSSARQDTSESIEVQITECQKYATRHGIILIREPFIDRAQTASSKENREAYQQLINLALSKECDFEVILTFHTSRWSRSVESELDDYLLRKTGVEIVSVGQSFTNESKPESELLKGILRKVDAYYSSQASKYTYIHQAFNAEQGFKNGGAPPDGYVVDHVPTGKKDARDSEKTKSRLVLDHQAGPFDLTLRPRFELIQFIFRHASEGKEIHWLTQEIKNQGWRSRYSDDPISGDTIKKWLTNPIYAGYMVWSKAKSNEISHTPLVEKDVFERIRARFLKKEGRKRGRPPKSDPDQKSAYTSSRYLLSGLIECSECGASYTAAQTLRRGERSLVYFACNSRSEKKCGSERINLAKTEEVVMDAVTISLANERVVCGFMEAFNEYSEDDSLKLHYEPMTPAERSLLIRKLLSLLNPDSKREVVKRLIKKVLIQPDKSLNVIWDLPTN